VDILDMSVFTDGGIVSESAFFDKVDRFDWETYRDKRVLVKGCGTTIIPPWAFMVVTARLAAVAKRVRYGNEHSSIPIFNRLAEEAAHVGE
jgi:hypothetical protein